MGSKNLKALVATGKQSAFRRRSEDFDFFLYEVKKISRQTRSPPLPFRSSARRCSSDVLGKRGLMPPTTTVARRAVLRRRAVGRATRRRVSGTAFGLLGLPHPVRPTDQDRERRRSRARVRDHLGARQQSGHRRSRAVIELNYLCNELGWTRYRSAGRSRARSSCRSQRGSPPALRPEIPRRRARLFGRWRPARVTMGDLMAQGSRALAEAFGTPSARRCRSKASSFRPTIRGDARPGPWVRDLESWRMPPARQHARLRSPGLTEARGSLTSVGGKAGPSYRGAAPGRRTRLPVAVQVLGFALSEEHYARLYSAVTGFELGGQEFLRAGEASGTWSGCTTSARDSAPPMTGFPRDCWTTPTRGSRRRLAPMLEEYLPVPGMDCRRGAHRGETGTSSGWAVGKSGAPDRQPQDAGQDVRAVPQNRSRHLPCGTDLEPWRQHERAGRRPHHDHPAWIDALADSPNATSSRPRWNTTTRRSALASTEIVVHRAIYRRPTGSRSSTRTRRTRSCAR